MFHCVCSFPLQNDLRWDIWESGADLWQLETRDGAPSDWHRRIGAPRPRGIDKKGKVQTLYDLSGEC